MRVPRPSEHPDVDLPSAPVDPLDWIPARALFDASLVALWITQVDGEGQCATVASNAAYSRLLAGTGRGRPLGEVRAGFDDDCRRVVDTAQPISYRDEHGEAVLEVTLSAVAAPFGAYRYVLGGVHAVGEERALAVENERLRAELGQTQKREALGALAAGLSAEIHNMLVTLQGHLDLARRDARRNPRLLKSLSICSRASRSASALTEQITALARAEPARSRALPLARVAESAAALLRATLPAGLDVEFSNQADTPQVQSSESELQMLVLQLGLAASRWLAGRAGVLRFCTDTVRATRTDAAHGSALRPGNYARLSVSALASETAGGERAEEAGLTTDSTRNALHAAREIAVSRGGALTLKRHGRGDGTACIYLPAADDARLVSEDEVQRLRHKTARRVQPAGSGERILLVDDQQWLLALVERLLAERGYQVRCCTSSTAALDLLAADPEAFDAIVTDYKMPARTGFDILRAVKAVRTNLPIVIISGYVSEKLREQAERTGADAVLPKQCIATDLIPILHRLLGSAEHTAP
jgi:CheY-like chemotaxis protein